MNPRFKLIEFYCKPDLTKYVDSLLFDDDEYICNMTLEDDMGNRMFLELFVSGPVDVRFNGNRYTDPYTFPDELKDLIKSRKVYNPSCNVIIENNNWFEVGFTISNKNGEELTYGGNVYEQDISKFTIEDIKKDLLAWAITIEEHYPEIYKDKNN